MNLWCVQGVAIAASTVLFSIATAAQMVPDGTLPVNSIVTPNGNTLTIDGGSRAGGNLFHSFKEFSVPTGSEAFFNNAIDVQNIFSRVTGSNISHIDGLIRANGAANLFLLNPNGIVFGPNARLNIGGSFISSTASSIQFADGTQFSTTQPSASPLLTLNVPVGLGFGSNPQPISVQGSGHNLTATNQLASAQVQGSSITGLQVFPGNTLALVGGDVQMQGGILNAEGGRIELGSVRSTGTIGIATFANGFTLDYAEVSGFGDIRLSQRSLADVSGSPSGSIQVRGRNVSLTDGSLLLGRNQGTQAAGTIRVNATESLEARGLSGSVRSGLYNDTLAVGAGGGIDITTSRLGLYDSAIIAARTFGTGSGGNVTIEAIDIDLKVLAPSNAVRGGTITTGALSLGNSGDINISTQRLSIFDGGTLSSSTRGSGQGGNIIINADSIDVVGTSPDFAHSSTLSTSVFSTGLSGNTTLNTRTLSVRSSAFVGASGFSITPAGNLTINARESIEVVGRQPGTDRVSQIRSVITNPPPVLQAGSLSASVQGTAGNVTINTPILRVADEGSVSVRNDGVGSAGNLQITAGQIWLHNRGSINAIAASGEGGNINLAANSLQLRFQSKITTTAGGTGNSGNMTINAATIVALENSDITANALQGRGGNIQISTNGIFGTAYRPQQTSESDITASSQFGVSGNVTISKLEVETKSFLIELPQNMIDTYQQITSTCEPGQGNSFTVIARGGLPEDPRSGLLGRAVWWDNRDLSALGQTASLPAQNLPKSEPAPEIVEATGWIINNKGQVELIAQNNHRISGYNAPNCRRIVAN